MLLSAAFTGLRSSIATAVDFRREQTRLLSGFNLIFLSLCGMAAIDCAALWLRLDFASSESLFRAGIGSGVIASILSFLVAKLPDWMSGEGSGIKKWLVAHASEAALAAAIVILAAVALIADLLAIKLLWNGPAYGVKSTLEPSLFGIVIGVVSFFVLLFGRSTNFVNLLALTPFYGSRLIRAYLGGANFHRLDTENQSEITHGDMGDDLSLTAYMEHVGPAPLHFINVTRNRTVGDQIAKPRIAVENDDPLIREDKNHPRGRLASYESSLTLHDRHGDRMVFGPHGVRVGAEFVKLSDLKDPPSLGLLCAISGAAVGSGMGRNTSLGTAMALTLANMRLGFWWKAQSCIPGAMKEEDLLFPGLSCLLSELLGRFTSNRYWHMSDGGHSENSGALSLLERGCRLIIVSDNGEDAQFQFGDLEIFIRTARTDIGMEVSVAKPSDFPKSLQSIRSCFLNGKAGDWRAQIRKDDNSAFALLLEAKDIPYRLKGKWKFGVPHWIIWIKPNRLADLPADIATYAEMNTEFPQQSTANQFFDEAQWESYRRLGFEMGRRLFSDYETLADFLPIIYRKPAAPAVANTQNSPASPPLAVI